MSVRRIQAARIAELEAQVRTAYAMVDKASAVVDRQQEAVVAARCELRIFADMWRSAEAELREVRADLARTLDHMHATGDA